MRMTAFKAKSGNCQGSVHRHEVDAKELLSYSSCSVLIVGPLNLILKFYLVVQSVIPALGRLRQEDALENESIMGYILLYFFSCLNS